MKRLHRSLQVMPMVAWRLLAALLLAGLFVLLGDGCATEPAAASAERRAPALERCTEAVAQTPPVSPWVCTEPARNEQRRTAAASDGTLAVAGCGTCPACGSSGDRR